MREGILTPAQCRGARALLDLHQEQLAASACVARKTVADFERSKAETHPRTLAAIRKGLEDTGIVFIPPGDGMDPGMRLRRDDDTGSRP